MVHSTVIRVLQDDLNDLLVVFRTLSDATWPGGSSVCCAINGPSRVLVSVAIMTLV